MGERSSIEWLFDPFLDREGATWNLWYGCERWSPACLNCYIFRQPPLRMRGMQFDKAAVGGKTEIVFAARDRLFFPLRKTKPLMIFVESLGDLWEGRVNIRRTAEAYAIMILAQRHIFITSTKRTRRQHNWLRSPKFRQLVADELEQIVAEYGERRIPAADLAYARDHVADAGPGGALLPPPNIWVGTTVEDNERAAERVPLLRDTPAAVRWLSCEPLTGETGEHADPLDLAAWLQPTYGPAEPDLLGGDGMVRYLLPGIDWVVFGGESGPAAQATELDTEPAVGLRDIDVTNLIRQVGVAQAAGARVFVKQLGAPWAAEAGSASKKGSDPGDWPAPLRLRRYPVQLAQRALVFDPDNESARWDVLAWQPPTSTVIPA